MKRSHRSALKKNGPKIDHWRTPYKISFHELCESAILVLCLRCLNKSYIKRSALSSNPYAKSLTTNKSSRRQLEGSVRRIPNSSPRSILSRHFSSRAIKQFWTPCPFPKPH